MNEDEQKFDVSYLNNLKEILSHLPLEKCTYEYIEATGELGWHAPEGLAFKITGRFYITASQSPTDMTVYTGEPSEELLIQEERDIYDICLEEANGDQELALSELIMSDQDLPPGYRPPKSFEGKWLVLRPNFRDPGITPEGVGLRIKDEVDIQYERDGLIETKDLTPDSDFKTTAYLDLSDSPQGGVIVWQQYYAEAIIGFCKIEMVEWQEKKQELYLPKPRKLNVAKVEPGDVISRPRIQSK